MYVLNNNDNHVDLIQSYFLTNLLELFINILYSNIYIILGN